MLLPEARYTLGFSQEDMIHFAALKSKRCITLLLEGKAVSRFTRKQEAHYASSGSNSYIMLLLEAIYILCFSSKQAIYYASPGSKQHITLLPEARDAEHIHYAFPGSNRFAFDSHRRQRFRSGVRTLISVVQQHYDGEEKFV